MRGKSGWVIIALAFIAGVMVAGTLGLALVGYAARDGGIVLAPGESVLVECAPGVATATETPVSTWTASHTPTPTSAPQWPTGTPTLAPDEATPDPTPTDIAPTVEPLEPTPTQDNSYIGECLLIVLPHTEYVNVRPGPRVHSGTTVGRVYPGDMDLVVDAVQYTDDGTWAHIASADRALTGWTAMEWRGYVFSELANTTWCDSIQIGPASTPTGTPEPVSSEIGGYHVLVGAREVLLSHLGGVGTIKCLTSSDSLCYQAKALKPEIVTVWRSLHTQDGMVDGPAEWEWYSASVYYAKLRPYLSPGFDYYEYINEWNAPAWNTRADWEIAMLDLLARDGHCGLFGSFGPGNPPLVAWDELVRVLRWIDANPCGQWPDGRVKYHGLALHQTGVMPDDVAVRADSYIRNIYITHRHEIVADYLKVNEGYDLADFQGPIYLTEMGWENYTIPDETFTCEEVARGWAMTREMLLHNYGDRLITGVHIWNFGSGGGRWVDLTPCLGMLR